MQGWTEKHKEVFLRDILYLEKDSGYTGVAFVKTH